MSSVYSDNTNAMRFTNNMDAHLHCLKQLKPSCPAKIYKATAQGLPTSEADVNSWLSDTEFVKLLSQKRLQCMVQAIMHLVREQTYGADQDPKVLTEALLDYFPEIQTVNFDAARNQWKSAEGIATLVGCKLSASSGVIFPFALMKLERGGAIDDEGLLHEIVVGLILNKLRSFLPCFMFVYGGFYCSYPSEADLSTSSRTNSVKSFCKEATSDKVHSVIMSEAIPNHKDFWDFLAYGLASTDDRTKVFLLLCFALDKASKEFDYTHGDLHAGNVLVRELAAPIKLEFQYTDAASNDSVKCEIETRFIPMIIDYGRSALTYKGIRLLPLSKGANNSELRNVDGNDLWCYDASGNQSKNNGDGSNCGMEYAVFKGQSVPGYDIIRFLTSLGSRAGVLHADVLNMANKCFYRNRYEVGTTSVLNARHLASKNNIAAFRKQTLGHSHDAAGNPLCSAQPGTRPVQAYLTVVLQLPYVQSLFKSIVPI